MNSNVTPLKLINDVSIRWNSTYYMIDRIVLLEESLAAIVGILHNPVILPTEEEWQILREITKILKPFEVVTIELSSEKQVTLSKIILIIKGLLSSVERIKTNVTSDIARIWLVILKKVIYGKMYLY